MSNVFHAQSHSPDNKSSSQVYEARGDNKRKRKHYLGTRRGRASLVFLLRFRLHGILLAGISDERSTPVDSRRPRRTGIDGGAFRSGASLRSSGDNDGVERCCCCCWCCCCCCCGVSGRLQPARCQGRRRRLPSLSAPHAGDAFHPNARRRRRRCTARHAAFRRARSIPAGFRALLEIEDREKKGKIEVESRGSGNCIERK